MCEGILPLEPDFGVEILSYSSAYDCLTLGKLPNLLLPWLPQDINSFSFMVLLPTWCPDCRKHSVKIRDEEEGMKKPQDSSLWLYVMILILQVKTRDLEN